MKRKFHSGGDILDIIVGIDPITNFAVSGGDADAFVPFSDKDPFKKIGQVYTKALGGGAGGQRVAAAPDDSAEKAAAASAKKRREAEAAGRQARSRAAGGQGSRKTPLAGKVGVKQANVQSLRRNLLGG